METSCSDTQHSFGDDMLCLCAGLLEGAHAGRGLGHEFLRHCQRARMLVHVIDGSSPDPVGDYAAIQTELELFAEELASKPQARRLLCDLLYQLPPGDSMLSHRGIGIA